MKNKMGDTQKMAFLNAMRKTKPNKKEEVEASVRNETEQGNKKPETRIFKTRAERRAASEGYTRPVAPLPVDEQEDKKEDESQVHFVHTKLHQVTLDDLYESLAEVQDYQSKDYTKETWLPFVSAFTQALEVYQSDEPTREELLVASDTLKVAKEQLIKR